MLDGVEAHGLLALMLVMKPNLEEGPFYHVLYFVQLV